MQLYLSVIQLGEVARGIAKLPDLPRRQGLHPWLEGQLLARFAGHIVAIHAAVMRCWEPLVADLEQQGRTLPAIDSLIAALALHNGLRLVTRHEADCAHTGVEIVNPWR